MRKTSKDPRCEPKARKQAKMLKGMYMVPGSKNATHEEKCDMRMSECSDMWADCDHETKLSSVKCFTLQSSEPSSSDHASASGKSRRGFTAGCAAWCWFIIFSCFGCDELYVD